MTVPGLAKSWVFLSCCISLLDCASPNAAKRPPERSPGERPSTVATVSGPVLWKSLAPGRETTLGVKADGSLWVWGWNREGGSDRRLEYAPHIDNGRAPVALRPTRIGDDRNWANVSASDGAFLALKTDGTLWGWDREERQRLSRG